MTRLTVYYDADCGLCSRLAAWLGQQRQLVPMQCVPKPRGVTDLAVVADTGDVWAGDSAWLIVLWALDDFRDWSYRLSRPELLPMARQAFAMISRNRAALSHWLGMDSDGEVAARLRDVELPGCAL
jgi:predicted DCC family thiol-disulfide oxidoreductase YuxK